MTKSFVELFCFILTSNFSISLWASPRTLIFIISGFLDVSRTPKTNMIYRWRHQDTPKNPRKPRITFDNIFLEI